jgi:hypothetical protein
MRSVDFIKVSEELKERMKKYPYINWSEVARRAIIKRIELEEPISSIEIELELLNEAIKIQDQIRKKTNPTREWSSIEEIRKWREQRR